MVFVLFIFNNQAILKTYGATRKPEFPGTGQDQIETSPGSGHVFENIFGSGLDEDKDLGLVRVGVNFYRSIIYFFQELKKKWN